MDNRMLHTPGCTPGPTGVIKQHKIMASGYELPTPERRVKTMQMESTTGSMMAPGLTNKGKRKR